MLDVPEFDQLLAQYAVLVVRDPDTVQLALIWQ